MAVGHRAPRLLIIGNGPTGVAANGDVHVDRSCGQFMELLACHARVSFAQPIEPVAASLNYFGHVLDTRRVRPLLLDRRMTVSTLAGLVALALELWRADFVYFFYPGTLPRMTWKLCRLLHKRHGVFLRGSQFEMSGPDVDLITRADFVLCVSEAIAEKARPLNRRTSVVRSAQDLNKSDAVLERRALAEGRAVQLLLVGRIDEEKGVPELIAAARLLASEKFDFELTLVGHGRLEKDLVQELAAEPDFPITLLGAIDDRDRVMQLFREADIFILPSHHEGFARVLYEAMLSSCVVVTTMVGGIPAVMIAEHNCVEIPVGDPQAIANAVRRIAGDQDLVTRLRRNGLQTALDVIANVPTHFDAFVAAWRRTDPRASAPAEWSR